uniref:Phospholipid-transporting ATPase n=1 Tax=Plectus sambesii TaxID=2011161 RepID=A0A914X167_9BILA
MTTLVMSDEPSTVMKIFYRFCFCFRPKPKPVEEKRRLKVNDRTFNEKMKHANNYIKTSKYSLITFVPKNLFEQFRRLTNTYFLVLLVLQFIPQISSLSPWTTILPLVAVLLVTGVKDAVDDINRHSSDNDVNNRISKIVRNKKLEAEKWMNVKVGDIMRLENNNFVAADMLLLSSSEPNGLCYIETTDLDGETNLKARQALTETAELGDNLTSLTNFKAEVLCEPPNNRISEFEGRITIGSQTLPIENDQVLLRGCRLRNTKWCYGMVIFAGRDTKLMMNSGKTIFKSTSLDAFLNRLIVGIVFFLIALCTTAAVFCGFWEYSTGQHFTMYLPWDPTIIPVVTETGDKGERQISRDAALISALIFFSYLMLLNTLVPISLYVSVEIIRVLHSWFINWDVQMYYEEKDIVARARTTTLNDELGQVQYIFSDKTGTLTQNIMTFNKCSIDGKVYGDLTEEQAAQGKDLKPLDFSENKWSEPEFKFYDPQLLEDTKGSNEKVAEFWRLIALCHTIMPDRSSKELVYQAQSPDEGALVAAARNFGYVFKSRTPKSITIEVDGKEELYDLLCILDFDNVRKR